MKIMFIFGIIGYLMRKLEFPATPFLIAFILGPMAEVALREAMVIHRGDVTVFFTRPISLVCLLLTVLSVFLIARRRLRGEHLLGEKTKEKLNNGRFGIDERGH